MDTIKLSTIVEEIQVLEQHGSGDPSITELAYDSRDVREGMLFFALKGIHVDGHNYIDRAVEAGAKVIVHSDPLEKFAEGVVYLRVENSRMVMSPLASAFHGHPSRKMQILGVTGTDGKSSTVSYVHQLLSLGGFKTGFLSTVQFNLGGETQKNYLRQSTPEAVEIHRLLRQMVDNGCTHAVVESTSHGLSLLNSRLVDVAFDAGILTNISHEHMEFHKTLERYVSDKANLFRMLPSEGTAVINLDDPQSGVFAEAASARVVSYSLKSEEATLRVTGITPRRFSQEVVLQGQEGRLEVMLNLPGSFNVENMMAALLGVSGLTGKPVSHFLPLVPQLKAPKGRMVPVEMGQEYTVLVDYAHTPGSFEKLFPILRKQTPGKLIAVFGSAGERDIDKRPIQGEIASRYADILVLTDEDPRQEDARFIIDGIVAGCKDKTEGENLLIIHDRYEAIRHACTLAGEGDTIVLLGKGHEGSIIYSDGPREWDEETAARRALISLGFSE